MTEMKSYVPTFEHFFHFQTRGFWTINEAKHFDGRVVLTIDFRDPSDEHNLCGRVGADG
jgi:hypothetical protein